MKRSLKVLYEDNHLLAVFKPHGLLTQPSGTDQDNLENHCKAYLKETMQKEGNVYLHAVHRLDKAVSGIVLFAKTSKALIRLNASMRNNEMKKMYLATVEGQPPDKKGTLEHDLLHGDHKAEVCRKKHPKAKMARLQYQVVESCEETTTLLVELETGRYHQIRAQLAAIGCPIVGDVKYGSTKPYQNDAIALQHSELQFQHPTTKDTVKVVY